MPVMNTAEILVLNGSPGVGKSTLTRAICGHLNTAKAANAVIDADEIALVFLHDGRPFEWKKAFMWRNLAAIWPNYAAIGDIRVIIPAIIDDETNLEAFKAATPGAKRTICELTAPAEILKQRVAERDPDDAQRMHGLIDRYHQRKQDNSRKYSDFEVSTHNRSVEEVMAEILTKAGW